MIFPAVFSLSVWSSCSEESVSSRVCNSNSEGRRALRYGIELGRAAITGTHTNPNVFMEKATVFKQECRFLHTNGLTWEGGDVIFEKALCFSRLCHEPCEGSLHISSLTCCLLPQNLIVRHGFPERLQRHTTPCLM